MSIKHRNIMRRNLFEMEEGSSSEDGETQKHVY